ncbi:MAG: tetratricopeptide repeat protein [Patescibacteria group bacterium]
MERNYSLSLENLGIFIIGFFFLIFPVFFLTVTTDAFVLPKQIILALSAAIGLFIVALRAVSQGSLRLRRTPFDLSLLLFGAAVLLSSIFSVNRTDSLIAFVPFLFILILFFAVVNLSRSEKSANFLSFSFLGGASLLSVFSLLTYFKVYILPFGFTKNQAFTPFGSSFDQSIYLILALSFGLYLCLPYLRRLAGSNFSIPKEGIFPLVSTALLLAGSLITLLIVLTIQKPNILPFGTGFQTAFAAISQDTGRVVQGFLFGSGFGTYVTDFTRFKQATFNLNPNLWNLYFFRSSSFILEILATTGLLGLLSLGLLLYKMLRRKPLVLPFLVAGALILILPFSFLNLTAIIMILALVSSYEAAKGHKDFSETEIQLVAFQKGVLALSENSQSRGSQKMLPYGFMTLVIILLLVLGFLSARYFYSDVLFQKSLVAASQNKGSETYDLQRAAIGTFPNREAYHRIFSQTNLSLANNLAASVPQGSSPSAQTQQTIVSLVQQSINSARITAQLSPASSISWQNMAQIYRSLIGFGQNAENFAIVATQRAIALDPNNPQLYISLGGIFYQLQRWDDAIAQFQIAVRLKPDFANAYYNLGHALEQKGELELALAQYQAVRNLVSNNKESLDQINEEIKALEAKIGAGKAGAKDLGEAQNQPPLEVNQPEAQLPPQEPPVKIPEPGVTVTPTKTPTPSPKPNL